MKTAAIDDGHPELAAARRAVAQAIDKLGAIEREALHLAPLIQRGEIAHDETADALNHTAAAHGLCMTERQRETVKPSRLRRQPAIRPGRRFRLLGCALSVCRMRCAT
jgi:hypothetical protein